MESGVKGSGESSMTVTSTSLSRRMRTNSSNSCWACCWASAVAADWKALLTAVSGLKLKFTGRIIKIWDVVCIGGHLECVAVEGHAHAMESAAGAGQFS